MFPANFARFFKNYFSSPIQLTIIEYMNLTICKIIYNLLFIYSLHRRISSYVATLEHSYNKRF